MGGVKVVINGVLRGGQDLGLTVREINHLGGINVATSKVNIQVGL